MISMSWIKLNDRQPDEYGSVLILTKDKYIFDAESLLNGFGYFEVLTPIVLCVEKEKVTHWMPLPKLPEE